MSIDERILHCFREVTGIPISRAVEWHQPLCNEGIDSLEVIDFLYTLGQSLQLDNVDTDHLSNNCQLTLNDIRTHFLNHLNSVVA